MEISRSFQVEAAHRLPHAPEGHKCRRLHGHSFRITIYVAGDVVEPEGWVMDFGQLAAAFAPLHEALDHRYLNEVEGLGNPTSEMLCRWVWERLEPHLLGLCAVEVGETCETACRYRGPGEEGGG